MAQTNLSRKPQKKKLLKRLELEKWQRHAGDTGSPECQIAALTVRIDALRPLVNSTARMDFSCKRGYVKLLARRRKMLAYLKRKDFEIYRKVALETGLR
ncbi:RpsO [Ectocarpus siliculosus]|uniref:RpsO n=1 Tax=Ectocarpus siliculosus TaxID=2880 RepID=D8LI83_ECTSI|nr:RpsO [Ectocarpus siliculosus]|eukprot:CBN75905.1 RpsO [Ectocarpus siliculosus]